MPRQLRKLQAFPEMPRHFRKCLISAIPCDIYTSFTTIDVDCFFGIQRKAVFLNLLELAAHLFG